jgi:hypothetical protein
VTKNLSLPVPPVTANKAFERYRLRTTDPRQSAESLPGDPARAQRPAPTDKHAGRTIVSSQPFLPVCSVAGAVGVRAHCATAQRPIPSVRAGDHQTACAGVGAGQPLAAFVFPIRAVRIPGALRLLILSCTLLAPRRSTARSRCICCTTRRLFQLMPSAQTLAIGFIGLNSSRVD